MESLHEPLSNADAYLERLGIPAALTPSTDFLDELIHAHQCSIPFENLDVCEKHLTPSLGVQDLFDKIVMRKRGGYCFELNALFAALLRTLGFTVQPAMARVLLRPTPYPLITHRANIVTIADKRYLADVGFGGPMAPFAPLMQDNASRTEDSHCFTLHAIDEYWWEVGYTGTSEDERRVLRVCTMPVEEHDFVPLSFYQAQNELSVFRQNRMVNIKTANGAYDLRNNTFTEFTKQGKNVSELGGDAAELDSLLAKKFGIVDWR